MAWTAGFWAAGVQGNSTNMNYTVLGVGDATTDFPAAATTNIGALALSKNGQIVYYSTGTTWQSQFVGIDGTPVQGDIFTFNGTKCTRFPIGTANQFMRTNSSANSLVWGTAATAAISNGTYSGDNTANRAIAHGLGVTPKYVLIKGTNTDWVTHEIFGTAVIYFRTNAVTGQWAVTIPDATNFYVGNAGDYSTSANLSTGPRTYAWIALG